jgi:hypothetical protein
VGAVSHAFSLTAKRLAHGGAIVSPSPPAMPGGSPPVCRSCWGVGITAGIDPAEDCSRRSATIRATRRMLPCWPCSRP